MRYSVIVILLVLCGCVSRVSDTRRAVVVSIAPLAWIASGLLDSTVAVAVLVPAGSSPETYEPTVKQVERLASSSLYLSVGLLDFEQELKGRMASVAPQLSVVSLSDGMEVIEGECSHLHQGDSAHGTDPHVWLSPRMMREMISKVAKLLVSKNLNPTDAVMARADSLTTLVDSLDTYISRCTAAMSDRTFAIVHPSMSYYARDYELNQIAVEIHGKEPSAVAIKGLVDTLRLHRIDKIFFGAQNSSASAQVIANEIGGTLLEYDPLRGDWLEGMYDITEKICN